MTKKIKQLEVEEAGTCPVPYSWRRQCRHALIRVNKYDIDRSIAS